jgi:hypothetical protein
VTQEITTEDRGSFRIPAWNVDDEKGATTPNSFKAWAIALLPQFARPEGLKHRKIGPTSYLDALRGYAAFSVFIAHVFTYHNEQNWQHQPFIYMIFNGQAMVALFVCS